MLPNTQQIEKRTNAPQALDVHSIFFTIQGEGPFCGSPAIFIRLAGCNLQCPLCDTDYTSTRTAMEPAAIVQQLEDQWGHLPRKPLVVITGGEPFRQNLTTLLSELVGSEYFVQIESNGTLPPSEPFAHYNTNIAERRGVYIVCSPKSGKVNPRIWEKACCVKYVMRAGEIRDEDGLPTRALAHTANPYLARPPEGWAMPVYLQPVDEQDTILNAANIEAVRESCMAFGYTLQLQIHKLIGVA